MQRVSGLDEFFMCLDTEKTTGHIAGIGMFTPKKKFDHTDFIRQRILDRLPVLPLLKWKLEGTPLALDSRHWVTMDHLDLDRHVHTVTLPKPGTEDVFWAKLDELMEINLERDIPMWQLYVVEGMEGGKFAYVFKVSHGLADGSALWTIFDHLSDDPQLPMHEMLGAPTEGDPMPKRISRGVQGALRKPARTVRLGRELGEWFVDVAKKEKMAAVPATIARVLPGGMSKPFAAVANKLGTAEGTVASLYPKLNAPNSPFNGNSSGKTHLVYEKVKISDLRAAGKVVGGTINDAVLAIMASTLRDYMEAHGGVGNDPIIAAVPISWRSPYEVEGKWANQVWMLFIRIPVHLSDPKERLIFCHDEMVVAKANWDKMPSHLLREASSLMPLDLVLSPGVNAMLRIPNKLVPRQFNISVSNVKGPTSKPIFNDLVMEDYFVYGFLSPGAGLLLGGMSYGDLLNLTTTADPGIVPDVETFPALQRKALDELLALANARAS